MTARKPPAGPWVKSLTIARKSAVEPAHSQDARVRGGPGRRGCRHTKFEEEADRILAEAFFYLYRKADSVPTVSDLINEGTTQASEKKGAAIYPAARRERYVRALFAMANDAVVRRRTAWLLEQRSRFWARPRDIVLHCMNVTAWCIAERRAATKLQQVEEWRRALIEAAARAEAEAAALDYRDNALGLRLGAADIEALAASRYEIGDPTLVTYRNCDMRSAEALARGTLRTLVLSVVYMHGRHGRSPLVGVAAAFAAVAAGVEPLTRKQAQRALPGAVKAQPWSRTTPRRRRSAGLRAPP